ncbi:MULTISPECIES: GNAT family N-acetyltransferase [Planococcus]|uniref:GNAT family N-acetyltransferase n=1 Tax=Planococcus faecalis TaxID=1598147 RepID=A0ABN4XQN2_9BACL|nr:MULTISPECIES: GNAT family N-acetyltransferase [Planococcus]AQU80083.1 GNAT family N-acetyltransferase [Planococcus faecalis]MDJ0330543.1 GNAT family N-acetyltransferase [Planococcus sp. S3-L1]
MYELIAIQDRSRWQKILDKLQITDIYYTSQYFLGALKLDPGEALLFYYKDDDGEVAYPFIKRVVNDGDITYFDVTTPFGYGGPILNVEKNVANLTANFRKSFMTYCQNEKIIAEYVRFHPLKENAQFFGTHLKISSLFETYTINLKAHFTLPQKLLLPNKEDVDNASELIVKKLGTVRHLFEFLVLYYAAARRREEADSYYFFTNDYFETLIGSMGSNLHLFGAFHENKLVSACYVLTMGDTIYYHLGGSLSEVDNEMTMRTLLLKIAEWGEENYYVFFHLGGDFQVEENEKQEIKKEIANCEPAVFYIGQQIHDQQTYDNLVSLEEEDVIRRYGNI